MAESSPPSASSSTPSPTQHPLSLRERIVVAATGVVLAIAAAVAVLSRAQLGFFMLVCAATIPWVVVLSRLRSWKGWPWVVTVMLSGGLVATAGIVLFRSTAPPSKAVSPPANRPATAPASGGSAAGDCQPTVSAKVIKEYLEVNGACWVPGALVITVRIDGQPQSNTLTGYGDGTIHNTFELNNAQLTTGEHAVQVEDEAHEAHAETTYTIGSQ